MHEAELQSKEGRSGSTTVPGAGFERVVYRMRLLILYRTTAADGHAGGWPELNALLLCLVQAKWSLVCFSLRSYHAHPFQDISCTAGYKPLDLQLHASVGAFRLH